ncbi:MAG: carbohydrate ABC transporter permease [Blautia sp.]|nr:carbohydrate ABC transporter permease [Blautia sp.]MDY4000197.1 carbohydrate ABC transporter permease [Blautia sp.]
MSEKFKTVLKYAFLIICTVVSVFPLLWMVIAATNKSVDVIAGKLSLGTNLVENYRNLIGQQPLWGNFWNSCKYAILVTVLALVVSSMAGYAFEIYRDKAKNMVFSVVLMTMMIPFVALMVPLFQIYSRLGLLNTTVGFILPSLATPFLIMMFRTGAKAFPLDIIEASRLEGLSEFQIFFRMFMPTMKSTYAAAAVVTFMNAWNNYLWAKVIMSDNTTQTMPMLISSLTSGYVTDYGMLMLAVLITTIPTAIVFFALQKYFVEGITGAVK